MSPRTTVERMIDEHKAAAEAAGAEQEAELLALLKAHEHFDPQTKTRTILLPHPSYLRAMRLSRIVDRRRGLAYYSTILTLTESITGRRVE